MALALTHSTLRQDSVPYRSDVVATGKLYELDPKWEIGENRRDGKVCCIVIFETYAYMQYVLIGRFGPSPIYYYPFEDKPTFYDNEGMIVHDQSPNKSLTPPFPSHVVMENGYYLNFNARPRGGFESGFSRVQSVAPLPILPANYEPAANNMVPTQVQTPTNNAAPKKNRDHNLQDPEDDESFQTHLPAYDLYVFPENYKCWIEVSAPIRGSDVCCCIDLLLLMFLYRERCIMHNMQYLLLMTRQKR